jgi:hypothetical protein
MPNLAWKNLLHDKLRFAITVAGVAFAVTLVFVQVGSGARQCLGDHRPHRRRPL